MNIHLILTFIVSLIIINGCEVDKNSFLSQSNQISQRKINLFFSKTNGNFKNGFDENITFDINHSSQSIYLAMYQFTNKKIEKALEAAYKRGVSIKVVTDDKEYANSDINLYDELEDAGIAIETDEGIKNGLMHNKILVIDNNITWVGSSNFTYYAFYRNYENMLRIEDKEIAQKYRSEILELWNKEPIKNPLIAQKYEIYLSPTDNIEAKLIHLIKNTQTKLYIMMYTFTSEKIAKAIIEAHKRDIDIKILLDKAQVNSKYTQYYYLKKSGVDVKLIGEYSRFHHKVFIIDNAVITGSYNLTYSANKDNCENIIIFKNNPYLKSQFIKYFKDREESQRE